MFLFVAFCLLIILIFIGILKMFWIHKSCNTINRLDGKTALVTGANCGIGKETAIDLAKRGAKVVIGCRNINKGQIALQEIKKLSGNANVYLKILDLASLKSVNKFANDFLQEFSELHILINNAGIMACPFWKTEDGFEMQIGVNHFGHFALTNLLLKRMAETKDAVRIVNVTSLAHSMGRINFDDINYSNRFYEATLAYGQSKLANILFTEELQRKVNYSNITTYAVHPGFVWTELYRYHTPLSICRNVVGRIFCKTSKEGAQTSIYCATKEGLEEHAGKYFGDCDLAWYLNFACGDEGQGKKLWDLSEKMTSIQFPL